VPDEPAGGERETPTDPASRKTWRSPSEMWDEEDEDDYLPQGKEPQYTASGPKPPARRSEEPAGGQLQKGETIAFMLLAGVAIGALAGWGIDALVGTFPAFMIVGVFAGFGLALYAVFIETR
jgi:F0F1-type ATP synthase assembly protein I